MITRDILIHLNLIPVGSSTILGYMQKIQPGLLTSLGLAENNFLSDKKLDEIKGALESSRVKFIEELQLIKKHQIKITTILDEDYPESLKEIYLPPLVLYWKGASLNFKKSISVVGARQADFLAKEAIDFLVPSLVAAGYAIVSGGAIGVDTMAHTKALSCQGHTVAILGSGLLSLYPLSNIFLFKEIEKTGAVVSGFSLKVAPLPQNFPIRNRIIAGFSRGTLVVQAAKKSGARITAEFALNQGRDVFAVPGPFNHSLSEGCNKLIQDGAKLVFTPEDILVEYGETIESKISARSSRVLKNSDIYKPTKPTDPILALCLNPKSLEDIQTELNITMPELQCKLFELQCDGKIEQNFAGLWVRV